MSAPAAIARLAVAVLFTALLAGPCLGLAVLERCGARQTGMRLLAQLQSFWSRALLRLLGFELVVEGEGTDAAHAAPAIVCANHLSHIDALVLGAVFPSRFVGKSEIRGWPVIGLLAALAGTLFIRRGDRQDVPRVVAELHDTLSAGVSVSFFPEGWASRGLRVRRFHAGLFEAAVAGQEPCLPVTLSYSTPPGTAAPAWTVAWWGPVPIVRHTLRMMREGPVRATVRFPAEPLFGEDRKELAERLQAEVAARFEPLRQEPVPPPLPGDPAPDEGRDVLSDKH